MYSLFVAYLQAQVAVAGVVTFWGSLTGIVGASGWALLKLLRIDKRVGQIHQRMFGHPDEKQASGLVHEVDHIGERVGNIEWALRDILVRPPE